MTYPPVAILLITYERTNIAVETIKGIKDRIHYPRLVWHVADDGSNGNHMERLINEIGPDYEITTTNTGGHSVGKSMNMGIEKCLEKAAMWLHWEDDWVPNMHIELEPCVRLLEQREDIGMIRMGRLHEGVTGEVISSGDRLWWKLDKSKHEWCFTGHAAMRHRRFHDAYGKYEEGLPPGRTEMRMLHNFNTIQGPDVVWPAWLRYDICDHIGDGYSYKEAMENRNLSREEALEEFNIKMDSLKVTA